jgi:hypothetical protein
VEIMLFVIYMLVNIICILPNILFQGTRLRRSLQEIGIAVRSESKYETWASRSLQGKYGGLIQSVTFVIPIFLSAIGLILWPTILQEPISGYVTFLILFMLVIYLSLVPMRLYLERWVRNTSSKVP